MDEGLMCHASLFSISSIPRKKCLYVNKALKIRFIHIKALFIGSIQVRVSASSYWLPQ